MNPKLKIATLLLSISIGACTTVPKDFIEIDTSTIPLEQVQKEYNPILEKSFCLDFNGTVTYPYPGLPFSVVLPICDDTNQIVMHTHPFFAERGANFLDFSVFRTYYKKFKNRFFGVYVPYILRVYEYLGD